MFIMSISVLIFLQSEYFLYMMYKYFSFSHYEAIPFF